MKFLGDMGVSQTVINTLRNYGYDAIHLRDEKLQKLSDENIIVKAKEERRIILTFDLDFGELLAFSGDSLPSVIIFRLEKANPDYVLSKLNPVLQECQNILENGAIITIKDKNYRVRYLPVKNE
ncbi:DUF5615 family PIN-like protein [Geminocystis sp. NIES-3709]|uniref:DUF5615 family PIN-like protein n=1 Tax=Geminocystis sp. NIES-3709 TaxID=1617448 RepID=UPI0005FCD86C|nr:DUF5615 family PIN-like protein [Geminocystis sp. NIES-3709]BAQ64016.1 hypothetical protein GM3709_781 [Geminocystis sp. NIES-3709]